MESSSILHVNIKWGKQRFDNVEVDTSEPPLVFKCKIFSITGVPPERQKLMGVKGIKGGKLEDDADWKTVGIKEGQSIMLIGTAGELPKEPQEKVIFYEDLNEIERNIYVKPPLPPGLNNLGNTCYLNSTVQCLKAIPELTQVVKGYKGQEQVTAQLRGVFHLLEHTASAVPPMSFVDTFRNNFPRFAQRTDRGYMQQDAEEFYSTLLHNISQNVDPLPNTQGGNAVNQLFGGSMLTEYKCLDSEAEPMEPAKEESFMKLSCHISGQSNFLMNGLKESLKEVITKRSPTLGVDASYEKRQSISSLPYYMVVQFVRFYYKREAQVKAKICRPVEFPFVLDVLELCTESLNEEITARRKILLARDEARQAQQRAEAMDTTSDASITIPPLWERQPYKNETGLYELSGIVTHKGRDADSGHYVAWVKERDDEWLCFDDETVKMCRDEDIKALAGKGGADWHIAYLCFYRPKPVE